MRRDRGQAMVDPILPRLLVIVGIVGYVALQAMASFGTGVDPEGVEYVCNTAGGCDPMHFGSVEAAGVALVAVAIVAYVRTRRASDREDPE